ncbi:Alpha-ketoglutarate-dependent taurine dioxygenase [plant metagenome]
MPTVLAHAPQPATGLLDLRPATAYLGADVHGIDLAAPLDDETVAALRAALLQWKVLVFRDQSLDHVRHVALARRFGEPTVGHPVFGYVEGHPQVYSVERDRYDARYEGELLIRPWSGWHTDVTPAIDPPSASILRADTVPLYGGDTQWTNLVAAYAGLSAPLRGLLDTLWAVHSFHPPEGQRPLPAFLAQVRQRPLVSRHPVVRVHPETGERALFVNPLFVDRIEGLSPRESEQVLALLFEHLVRPEYTFRLRWKPGTVVFWDNRATAHAAPREVQALGVPRQLFRVTLRGDVPRSVRGEPSQAIEGRPLGGSD